MENQNNIKEYVSHLSAAESWNIPYMDYFLKNEYLNGCRSNMTIEITVTEISLRYPRKGCKVHLNTRALPRGAVVKRDGILVTNPEFVFLELATELNIYELILFGLQLCAHPPGRPEKAVTTKRKLDGFLGRAKGYDGYLKAKKALLYIKNGSNSIMESIVFMFLSLPYRLGGYGFGSMCFNSEIVLDISAQTTLSQKRCYVDLYYPEGNLAIEYDSTEHHSEDETYDKDMLRSNIIKGLGVDVLHITRNQLYHKKVFEQLAHSIAKQSNKRLRYQTKTFYRSNILLRKLLP